MHQIKTRIIHCICILYFTNLYFWDTKLTPTTLYLPTSQQYKTCNRQIREQYTSITNISCDIFMWK